MRKNPMVADSLNRMRLNEQRVQVQEIVVRCLQDKYQVESWGPPEDPEKSDA